MVNFARNILWLLLVLWGTSVPLRAATPFPLKSTHHGEPLGRHLFLYKDETGRLTAQQIAALQDAFQPSQDDYPNWSMTSATTWAYFQIDNPSSHERPLFLENYYAMTDAATLYAISKGEVNFLLKLGDRLPFSARPVFYRHPVFPLTIKPGMNEFLISIQTSGPNRMPFQIWTPTELQRKMTMENYFIGGAFGLIAFMIVYNYFIFLSLHSQTYLFYVAYGLGFLIMQIGLQGVAGYIFSSTVLQEWFSNWGFLVGVQACNLFATMFSMRFLDLRHHLPRVNKVFAAFCWLYGSVLLGIIVQVDYHIVAFLTNAMTALSTLSMLTLGLYFTARKHRPAYFYTVAWVFILLGGLSFSLSNMGALPVTFLTTYGSLIGGCCEMSLLSFALADRVRLLREMRNQEKELYIQSLMQKDKETQHSYTQLAKIVYPHQISLMKRGYNLEETMQTGRSNAVVLVFDVIGSTRFTGHHKQEFFQKVFTNCYQRMMRQYDEKNPLAEAYRIKELGDGFMCSIGFPFPIPDDLDRNAIAMTLALDFIEIWNRIRHELYPDHDIFCSIGMAEGEVHGFYPVAGVREYDLYGAALVLANRYENLRRVLFADVEAHILTAQASFVEKLPLPMQLRFKRHDLSELKDFQIRNDPNAKAFYTIFLDQKDAAAINAYSA
jgi:class 3 adenylate cyclase